MKTTMLLILVLFSFNLNAQWYTNQYNVTDMNQLSKAQLEMSFKQAETLTNAGIATTLGCVVLAIIGTAIYSQGLDDIVTSTSYTQINDGVDKGMNGALLMTVGYVGVGVGGGLWIAGAQRKNSIKIHMMKYGSTSYTPAVGIKFTF